MLWAIVDPERPRDGYTEIVAWGTGWPLPDDVYKECDYWGTCEDGYGYIWHYFAAARFPDCYVADKVINTWDSDKYNLTGYPPYSAPTITISCDGSDAASALSCDKLAYDPSITATCIGTISSNAYSDNVKIDFDKLIGIVEKYVEGSATATNNACR